MLNVDKNRSWYASHRNIYLYTFICLWDRWGTCDIGIDDVEAVGRIAMSVGIFRQLDTMGLIDCRFVGLFDNVEQMICVSLLF